MNRKVKARSRLFLELLISGVFLMALPNAAVAQTCSSVDSMRQDLRNNVEDLYDNLIKAQIGSSTALSRFGDILSKAEVLPEVGFGDFFETLLVENIYKQFEDFPGFKVAKDTLVGVLKFNAENRAAFDSRKRRSAHDWLEREQINLANIYEYNVKTNLLCAYANAYLLLPAAGQDRFVSDVGKYAVEIGGSIKNVNEVVIELIEQWLNSTFSRDFRTKGEGFLVVRVKFEGSTSGLDIKSLKLASSAYSQQMGHSLNNLLKDRKMKPFDLKVYKLILFHDSDHDAGSYIEEVWERSLGEDRCKGYEKCVAAAFLDKNNKIVLPTLQARVRSKLDSLKNDNFNVLGKFTD